MARQEHKPFPWAVTVEIEAKQCEQQRRFCRWINLRSMSKNTFTSGQIYLTFVRLSFFFCKNRDNKSYSAVLWEISDVLGTSSAKDRVQLSPIILGFPFHGFSGLKSTSVLKQMISSNLSSEGP